MNFVIIIIKISMNVHQGHTIAMLMPTVPIPRDRFIARVMRDTLEMESYAWVSIANQLKCVTSSSDSFNVIHTTFKPLVAPKKLCTFVFLSASILRSRENCRAI